MPNETHKATVYSIRFGALARVAQVPHLDHQGRAAPASDAAWDRSVSEPLQRSQADSVVPNSSACTAGLRERFGECYDRMGMSIGNYLGVLHPESGSELGTSGALSSRSGTRSGVVSGCLKRIVSRHGRGFRDSHHRY